MKNLILVHNPFSQIKKFRRVSESEFGGIKKPEFKDTNAIILFKKRRTYYDYGSTGLVIHTKIQERIKILNKNGYIYATKKIALYKGNSHEGIQIKANTYNLVANKVI